MALSSTYVGGVYTPGTVTVSGDKITVVGVGTLWSTILEAGDWILIAGQVGLVASVADDTHLLLQSQWSGTLPSASAYVAIKMSWLRYDPALTQAKLRELLAQIAEQGNFIFTDVAPPDPALGQDGQWALKTDVSPWRLWYKTGGVWVEQKAPAGIAWRGVWSAATTYAPSDAVSYSGASYLAKLSNVNKPPASSPTEWDLMAAQGATGATGATGPIGLVWRGTWSAATAYIVNDGVALNGASYIAIAPNTNQSPPNATYWNVLAGASSTAIANDAVTPPMLDAGTAPKQQAFRDRIVAAPVNSPAFTGGITVSSGNAVFNSNIVAKGTNKNIWLNGATPSISFANDVFSLWVAGAIDASTLTINGNSAGPVNVGGDISVAKPQPQIMVSKTASGQFNSFSGLTNGVLRWIISPGDSGVESGSNLGSDFALYRYSDAGAYMDTALYIRRNSGAVTISSPTPSSNASSGALIVSNGGVGIAGALNVGGPAGVIGALTVAGGVNLTNFGSGLIKGGAIGDTNPNAPNRLATNFVFYDGGASNWAGIGADQNGNVHIIAGISAPVTRLRIASGDGQVWVPGATPSSNSSTGALVVVGGVGIQGAVNIAGQLRPAVLAMGPDAVYLVDIRIPSTGSYIGRFCNTHAAPGDNVLIVGGGPNSSDSATILFAFCDAAVNTIWGSITRNGTGISYNQTSDERGKPNRERLSLDFARGIVDALEIYDHDKEGNKLRGIGMLAQQAHAVHPSLAQPGQKPDAWWMAEKAAPMPFVIANMQQLNQRMDEMERRLAA